MSRTYRSATRGTGHGYTGAGEWSAQSVTGRDISPTRDGFAPHTAGPYVRSIKRHQKRAYRHSAAHALRSITRDPSAADAAPWPRFRPDPWAWD